MTKFKKTVAVDFDGVIHGYQSGWHGADNCPDPPVPGTVEFLRAALGRFEVVIYSTRAETREGRLAIRDYLLAAGLTLEEMNEVLVTSGKPKAVLYIDDRAHRFDGEFPTLDFIDEFRPYKAPR